MARRFSYPFVTPSTMFAMSVRVRPCRLRWKPSSLGRSTRIAASSRTTRISGWRRVISVPRGPFTVTEESSIVTSTPLGISMGCLPMRLISLPLLPDVRQDLAADALAGGVTVRHHTLRRRHDGDAETTEHARETGPPRVHASSRTAHTLQPGDRALALRAVLQRHAECPVEPVALRLVSADEPLGRKDLHDRLVHLGRWHDQVVLVREVRVADPRQQVPDGVRDIGGDPHHDALVTPGSSPACASSRRQIRQSMKPRYTARARPHREHRVYSRTLNLCCCCCLLISAFFAMSSFSSGARSPPARFVAPDSPASSRRLRLHHRDPLEREPQRHQ